MLPLTEQKIIGRMQVIAELLGIGTNAITLRARQSTGDFDSARRWSWDMISCDARSGGIVACDVYDRDYDYSIELTRSFAHLTTRALLPHGEYEALAERAYYDTPPVIPDEITILTTEPPRMSAKELLNDLVLSRARDIIYGADQDEIPTAEDILKTILSSRRLVSLAHDIDTYRERAIRDHANSD